MSRIIDNYHLVPFRSDIDVTELVSVHYFEYSKNYIFEGEKHDFWEFLYVDKGVINVMADDRKYILKQGEMIFHKPKEWHNVIANGEVAPNLIVMAFACHSESMRYFENKVLAVNNKIKNFLGYMVSEAKASYASDLSDPQLKSLKKRKKEKFGSEQMIKSYLELMLIELIREEESLHPVTRTSDSIREYAEEEKVNIIINVLKDNVHESLTLDDISKKTLLSKS